MADGTKEKGKDRSDRTPTKTSSEKSDKAEKSSVSAKKSSDTSKMKNPDHGQGASGSGVTNRSTKVTILVFKNLYLNNNC